MTAGKSERRLGRPRRYREPRRDIHLSLSERVIKALDIAAQQVGRSAYVEHMLRQDFGLPEVEMPLSQAEGLADESNTIG